jgi:hypothetical protein
VTVDEFLGLLEGVRKTSKGWSAKCPAHDDRHASLAIAEGREGQVLLTCHAGDGCTKEAITAAVGRTVADLFPGPPSTNGHRRIVATYDYVDEDGVLLYQVVRFEPKTFRQRRPDGRGGYVWGLGKTRRVPYRLPLVLEAAKAGRTIYDVEGEKDVHAFEAAGEVATCNPMGAGKWRASYSKALRGANVVIVQDRDEEGRKHAAHVAEQLSGVAASVQIVEAAEGKDAADHLAAGLSVTDFVPVPPPDNPDYRTNTAESAWLSGKNVRNADPDTTRTNISPDTPGRLAAKLDILAVFLDDLRRVGLAGEQRAAQLTYLMLTSPVLPWGKSTERPVSGCGKGPTSTGKSATQEAVLAFFPPEAIINIGSMSRRFMQYDERPYAHRFIVVPEYATIKDDDEIIASLRTLLSEGRLVHGTVDGDGRREARLVEKEGPTGLLMTTTQAGVDPELETRCVSFLTDDTPEQTRRIFLALADLEDGAGAPVDFEAWHQLQRWIGAHGENRVAIPYIKTLAELMPTSATRLRRDFISMLCLVRAHAILHQQTRRRDDTGRIVATIADYAAVHGLLDELVAEAVDAGVSAAMRQTAEAARTLLDEQGGGHLTAKKITDRLNVGKSAGYDRIKRALSAGYLINEAKEGERGMKIVMGADLPAGGEHFLPDPATVLSGSCPDSRTGQSNGLVEPEPVVLSGSPGCPPTPLESEDEAEVERLPRRAEEWGAA